MLPTEEVNEGIQDNLNSEVKFIVKRINESKVLEMEIIDATDYTHEIKQTFIEATLIEVNTQELLSGPDESVSQNND